MGKDPIFELCDKVRVVCLAVHSFLRHGHLEKVYENAVSSRLGKLGLRVEQQAPLHVRDEDGTLLGKYYADLLVEDHLLVELKACSGLVDEHFAQILGYLRATGLRHGLLVNFGLSRLEIRKVICDPDWNRPFETP